MQTRTPKPAPRCCRPRRLCTSTHLRRFRCHASNQTEPRSLSRTMSDTAVGLADRKALQLPRAPAMHPGWAVAKAYIIGAWDSVENVLENLTNKLGWRLITPQVCTAPLHGKVCIITGANAGIGLATSELLAQRGAHVIMACRSRERGEQAAEHLRKRCKLLPGCGSSSPSVEVMEVDMSSMDSVRKFCRTFNARQQPLHLLVANAGIMSPATRLETPDGLEMQFQVNFLGHWLMINELLGEQRRRRASKQVDKAAAGSTKRPHFTVTALAGPETPAQPGGSAVESVGHRKGWLPGWGLPEDSTRVVILSSLTHHAGVANWKDMQSTVSYNPFTSYALSKLANAMAAVELQRRLDRHASGQGPSGAEGRAWGAQDSVVAVHPGIVNTGLATNFFKSSFLPESWVKAAPFTKAMVSGLVDSIGMVLFKTPETSAAGLGCAALAPHDKVAGKYLVNGRPASPATEAHDPLLAQELWSYAEKLTGVKVHESLL